MKVKVLFFAACRDVVNRREIEVDVPEGSTAEKVLQHLCETYPRLSELRGRMALAVNQEYAGGRTVLNPGDTLALIPPLSGGG